MFQNKFISSQLILVALSTLLIGISTLLSAEDKSLSHLLTFFFVDGFISPALAKSIIVSAFLTLSVTSIIAIFKPCAIRLAAYIAIVVSIVPILTLLDSSRWIDSLGGFPAIGSGQGIIKYFSLAAIGVSLLLTEKKHERLKLMLHILPVALVLLWIGGMKFTLIEAQGIEPLIQSSPFMSWMYDVASLQQVSNIIGIYDLVAMACLVIGYYYRNLLLLGFLLSAAVMVTTQTYLFTWPAALSSDTVLSSGGQFLIKDLWYIANLIFIGKYLVETKTQD